MPKVKLKVNELVDTEVSEVSLVERGANKVPFRILKADEPAETVAKITSIHISKQAKDAFQVIKPIIEKLGIVSTEKKENSVVFRFTEGGAENDASGMMLNKDVAVCFNVLDKGLYAYVNSDDFTTSIQVNNFYMHIGDAGYILKDVIYRTLDSKDSKEEAIEKVTQNINAYRKYVVGMIKKLPEELWEIDQMLSEM